MEPAALRLLGVTKYFAGPGGVTRALKGVEFELRLGEFAAVMGPSGSGKSTLLKLIATLETPTAGSIEIGETNLAALREERLAVFRRDRLGVVFQNYNLIEVLTAEENILLPLDLAHVPWQEEEKRLRALAEDLGIAKVLKKFPRDLSGGEQQRVAIARALITRPAVLLADEPTGALDSAGARALMELFCSLNAKNKTTVFMATHDAWMASYTSRVLFLRDGRIFNEIYRGQRAQKEFYEEILAVRAALEGGR